MLADTGIKAQVQEEICQFAEKYRLERVVLFGSRARSDYHRPAILTWRSGAAESCNLR